PRRSSRFLLQRREADASALLRQRAPELLLERGTEDVQLLAVPRPRRRVERPGGAVERPRPPDDPGFPLIESVQHGRTHPAFSTARDCWRRSHHGHWRRRRRGLRLSEQDGFVERSAAVEGAAPSAIAEPELLRPPVAAGDQRKRRPREVGLVVGTDRQQPPLADGRGAELRRGPGPLSSPADEGGAQLRAIGGEADGALARP